MYTLVKARLRLCGLDWRVSLGDAQEGRKEVLSMIGANITNETRKAIYRREGFECALCGSRKYLQVHHVVKRSLGGSSKPWNLICLCASCHALAHGTWLEEGLKDITPEDIYQGCVEYLSDYYAEEGQLWNPKAEKLLPL